jgi:tetratricopeptide (TPR) repeat protein
MATPVRVTVLLALLSCLSAASRAEAQWRRIDSPNFVVMGDLGARDLRDIAVKFEAFRETLSRVLTERAIATAVPTVVIVFPNDRAFTPFKPRFQGKPIDVGGLFVPRQNINFIAIVSDGDPRRLPTVFHEYAHLVISNVNRTVPVWLSEGLAEYYSTFELSRDGREALLGLVPEDRLARLNQAPMLPLETLLTVDHDSSLYNEGNRRSTFYAQAWALTHLILLGKPRTPQLLAYLDNLSAGMAPRQAWGQAFGSQDLARELESYVRQQTFRATRYRFTDKLATFDAPSSAIPPEEVQAILAEFLIHQRRFDEAAERITAAAKTGADNPRVGVTAAFLELGRSDFAAAEARLRRVDPPKDWLTAYLAGIAVAELAEHERPGSARLDAARRYFAAARASWPEFSNALARMAELELRTREGPTAEARTAIERARALAPGRHDYAMIHAQILARQSDYPAARRVLEPLMSNQYEPDIRDGARSLLARIVDIETSRLARSGGLPAGADAAAERSEFPAVSTSRPVFRQLLPGEQRLEGALERIDCSAAGAVFHVKSAAGMTTFLAPKLDEVDFITYRSDLTGNVECGPAKQPVPVYLPWRPAADGSGARIVVAVEFPPKAPETGVDSGVTTLKPGRDRLIPWMASRFF